MSPNATKCNTNRKNAPPSHRHPPFALSSLLALFGQKHKPSKISYLQAAKGDTVDPNGDQ
jgi:hypothetical protein